MKRSTTKLVTFCAVMLLVLGGIIVWVWQTTPKQEMSKSAASQSAEKAPQTTFDTSKSPRNPSVVPVQKLASPPATEAEAAKSVDETDWDELLTELEGESEEDELTSAPVTKEEESSEEKFDNSSKSEQWKAEVEAVKMQIMQTISERAHAFRELERLGKIPNPDPALVSKYILGRRLIGYEVMQNVAKYIRLTGDMAAIEPGGWIYEYGHATGGFLFGWKPPNGQVRAEQLVEIGQ